jgi:6-phosphogluconate dehydrogenase (decarboxylating)
MQGAALFARYRSRRETTRSDRLLSAMRAGEARTLVENGEDSVRVRVHRS